MTTYIIKRLLLMIPTILGIMLVTFIVTQFVPGGPVERLLAQMQGNTGAGGGEVRMSNPTSNFYQGGKGLDEERRAKLKTLYSFAARKSDHIIAVSESTKKDEITFLGSREDKISVIHNGIDSRFFEPCTVERETVKNNYKINKFYCFKHFTSCPLIHHRPRFAFYSLYGRI